MIIFKNIKLNSLSRLICSTNSLRITRNVATRRKAPELPLHRGEQIKISGFGKFLMVRILKFNRKHKNLYCILSTFNYS